MPDDFDVSNAREWSRTVDSLGLGSVQTATWRGRDTIMQVLEPFMGENLCHTHLPTGGGHSFDGIRKSPEDACIEMCTGPRSWHLVKPRSLTIELFPNDPIQTFMMLELEPIMMTDAYDDEDRAEGNDRFGQEEVVRLPSGEYIPRDFWDDQIIIDDDGYEAPMPKGSVLTIRWLRGRMLFVAKRSLWNRTGKTYRGLHNGMDASQVREMIEGGRIV